MRETGSFLRKIRAQHQRLFEERFPMLPDVDMEYTWTGYVCLSHNGSPEFGEIADNVYASVCQNAIGTKGTVGGMLAADMACGVDNELIGFMQSLGEPSKMPPRPFLDLGVRSRMARSSRESPRGLIICCGLIRMDRFGPATSR